MSFTRLANSSSSHFEDNDISTRQKLITSGEFIFQPFNDNDSSINTTINDEKTEVEEVLPSKFEHQYALNDAG